MKETRLTRKLKNRVSRGNLPFAFDIWNESDIGDICISLTAMGNICPERVGTIYIFEVSEDER